MPTLFLCDNCQSLKAIYLAKYPKDYKITIMCHHYWEKNIKNSKSLKK